MTYNVIVTRQTTPIAAYGSFNDLDSANEFARVYLDHESNVRVVPVYRYHSDFVNRDEMKFI